MRRAVHMIPWLLAGCAEALPDDSPYVTSPRVLAVAVSPPEVAPGGEVTVSALFADASGELSPAPLSWGACMRSKPLAELGPVAPACLDPEDEGLAPLGSGTSVIATVATDVCSRFGPNPPLPLEGEPAGRPVDPDVTGGFHQPVLAFRTDDDVAPTLASVRLRCGLADVSQETYIAWNLGYRSNVAPVVEAVTLAGVDVPADGASLPTAAAGEPVELGIAWPACPRAAVCGDGVCSPDEDATGCPEDCTTPVGCAGAETYLRYDPITRELGEQREGVSATWYTTAGTLELARSGRDGEDDATSLSNVWTPPDEAGEVWLAVVLRDERGGIGFRTWRVDVE